MKIPRQLADKMNRRFNGRKLPQNDVMDFHLKMQFAYLRYLKITKKLDYLLDVEWEEKGYEDWVFGRVWKNAHRRLRKYEAETKELHKQMFYLLLNADGNYEEFDSGSFGVDEIIENFYQKYGGDLINLEK